MVQLIKEWLKGCVNVGKINHPTTDFSDGTFHMNSYSERVAVKPMAFMIRRDVRQTVRRFKSEFPKDVHWLPNRAKLPTRTRNYEFNLIYTNFMPLSR